MKRAIGFTLVIILGLSATAAAGVWWYRSRGDSQPIHQLAAIKRGNLVATIGATGTVEPEQIIQVGAQVAGLIKAFGQDQHGKQVDYGSEVEAGTVLAKIDDTLYSAAVQTAQAQLEQAEANKISAGANLMQMKAKLVQATQDWGRAQKLGPSDALAQSAYDQYQASFEVAKANVASAEAAVDQAKAGIAQAKAVLATAKINLGYCTIRSPVKGVIVDRQVQIGQTVVSSLSAPSLFLIATDLKRVLVWVSVNEADIGAISEGAPVRFTVDAYPDRVFKGQVGKIRLNATTVQNVVTYTVTVATDNQDGQLLPFLTANAKIWVGQRDGVLLVRTAALSWTPSPGQVARPSNEMHGRVPPPPEKSAETDRSSAPKSSGILWIEQGRLVRPLDVKIGLSDDIYTEVEGPELTEGLRVIVGGPATGNTGEATERSPFAPQNPFAPQGRGQRQGQGAR